MGAHMQESAKGTTELYMTSKTNSREKTEFSHEETKEQDDCAHMFPESLQVSRLLFESVSRQVVLVCSSGFGSYISLMCQSEFICPVATFSMIGCVRNSLGLEFLGSCSPTHLFL